MTDMPEDVVLHVRGLRTQIGGQIIHDNLDLEVRRGEIMGVVGASGSGKSVLLRTIVGLNPAVRGTISVMTHDIATLSEKDRLRLQARWGVLFQDGALFSSLTVAQNIQVPLREHLDLSSALLDELTTVKLDMVGLPPDTGSKYPAQLSGGMRKRAGLARALALDPEILFLDEPTAGLDPIGAAAFDALIRTLQRVLDLTVFLVTHDLDSLIAVCDRIAVLVDKHVIVGTMDSLLETGHPWIEAYFTGPRGRVAAAG